MSEGLRSLEKLRADAVEQAREALAQERAQLTKLDDLVRSLAAGLQQVSAEIERARAEVALDTVADFAWAERMQRRARVSAAQSEQRLRAAQAQRAQTQLRVQLAERSLLDAELGRRAVGHVMAQREAARAHKLELRSEEDAEDTHRARRR